MIDFWLITLLLPPSTLSHHLSSLLTTSLSNNSGTWSPSSPHTAFQPPRLRRRESEREKHSSLDKLQTDPSCRYSLLQWVSGVSLPPSWLRWWCDGGGIMMMSILVLPLCLTAQYLININRTIKWARDIIWRKRRAGGDRRVEAARERN